MCNWKIFFLFEFNKSKYLLVNLYITIIKSIYLDTSIDCCTTAAVSITHYLNYYCNIISIYLGDCKPNPVTLSIQMVYGKLGPNYFQIKIINGKLGSSKQPLQNIITWFCPEVFKNLYSYYLYVAILIRPKLKSTSDFWIFNTNSDWLRCDSDTCASDRNHGRVNSTKI